MPACFVRPVATSSYWETICWAIFMLLSKFVTSSKVHKNEVIIMDSSIRGGPKGKILGMRTSCDGIS